MMTTWYLDKEKNSAHEIVKVKRAGDSFASVVANIMFNDEIGVFQCLMRVDITADDIITASQLAATKDTHPLTLCERLNGKGLINKADLAGVIIRAQNFMHSDGRTETYDTIEAKMLRSYMAKVNQIIGYQATKEALIYGTIVRTLHKIVQEQLKTDLASNDSTGPKEMPA